MTKKNLLCWTLLLTIAASAHANKILPVAPTTGEWKNQPLGAWIVLKTVSRGRTVPATAEASSTLYQRNLLVGTDEHGAPWFSVFKSNSADGPWTFSFQLGGGTAYGDLGTSTTQPAETLHVGEAAIECSVKQYRSVDDAWKYDGKIWTDAATGIDLQQIRTSRPRDEDAPQTESVSETKLVAIAMQRVNGLDCKTFLQQTTERFNGKTSSLMDIVLSPDVPGRRLSSKSWRGGDRSKPTEFESEVIAWGIDRDGLVAEQKRIHEGPRRADEQLKEYARFVDDAESATDVVRRAKGVEFVAMNHFASVDRPRIERIDRAALASDEPTIFRAGAEAAGIHHIAGTSPRIVELLNKDPGGAFQYLRALGRLAEPAGLDAVLVALRRPEGMAGSAALEAIVNFSDDRATDAMKQILQDQKNPARRGLVGQLSRGQSRHAIELLSSVADDPDFGVRETVQCALAEQGRSEGLNAAIKALGDQKLKVRVAAAMAVGGIGEKSADPKPAADALVPLLDPATPPQLRGIAALSLARMKDSRVLTTLRDFATSDLHATNAVDENPFAAILPSPALGITGLQFMATQESYAMLVELSGDPKLLPLAIGAMHNAHDRFRPRGLRGTFTGNFRRNVAQPRRQRHRPRASDDRPAWKASSTA